MKKYLALLLLLTLVLSTVSCKREKESGYEGNSSQDSASDFDSHLLDNSIEEESAENSTEESQEESSEESDVNESETAPVTEGSEAPLPGHICLAYGINNSVAVLCILWQGEGILPAIFSCHQPLGGKLPVRVNLHNNGVGPSVLGQTLGIALARGCVRFVLVSDSINHNLPWRKAESTADIKGQSMPGARSSI